jgi:hypothetical protein
MLCVALLSTPAADVGTVYFTTLDNKVRKVRAGLEVLFIVRVIVSLCVSEQCLNSPDLGLSAGLAEVYLAEHCCGRCGTQCISPPWTTKCDS